SDCQKHVADLMLNGGLQPIASFFRVSDGRLEASLTGPLTLTLEGCEALCGGGYGLYPIGDILDRLIDWFVPIVLVFGNMQLPSLGFWSGVWTRWEILLTVSILSSRNLMPRAD